VISLLALPTGTPRVTDKTDNQQMVGIGVNLINGNSIVWYASFLRAHAFPEAVLGRESAEAFREGCGEIHWLISLSIHFLIYLLPSHRAHVEIFVRLHF
jgi:hypothetical protein